MAENPVFKTKITRNNSSIWVGKFYKVNLCGKHEVPIKSKKDRPCDNKYEKCVSYDKGTCVEIIKMSNTRYIIYGSD